MTTTTSQGRSPVRLEARLDGDLSRGLWLVKWFLLVPHLIVLFFLWLAFPAVTFVALVAILFTGRYPRPLFDFNLGVMRWTWRVWCYGYGALATDRYPPFSLDEEPDYPATLDVAYPERLSRGLVLVKWWLLAIPHYLVLAFFTGGGGFVLWQWGEGWLGFDGGLVTLLSVFAGVALLFTGGYPRGIFDLVVGMNRWMLRVGAYAALMTDEYPPFRLDLGGEDHAGAVPETGDTVAERSGWTPARTAGVVVGVLLLVIGTGAAAGGGALMWLNGQRDEAGYVATPVDRYADSGYALRFDAESMAPVDRDWPWIGDVLGDVRVRVTAADDRSVFAGIARTADVERYLDGVPHRGFTGGQDGRGYRHVMGAVSMRPPAIPGETRIWEASVSGTGTRTLEWAPRPGDWSLVVMNLGAEPDVEADVTFAATAPALLPVAIGVLSGGVVFLIAGALVVAFAARPRRHR